MPAGALSDLARLRIRVLAAASLTLLGWFSITVTIAVLPRIVSSDLAAGEFAVGLISGVYGLSSVLVRPVAGRLADRYGRSLVGGVGSLFLLAGALMLFLPPTFWLLAISRVVAGVGIGAVVVSMLALIVDLAPDGERAYWVGFNGIAMWIAFALGPPVSEFLYSHSGYGAIWFAACTAPVIALGVACALPRGTLPELDPTARLPWIAREALSPGLMFALATTSVAALTAFLILHLESRGIAHGASALTVYGASVVVARLFVGRIPDRYDPAACVLISLAGQSLGLMLIAIAPDLLITCMGTMVIGASFSLIFPALALIVTNRAPLARRGVALGTYSSSLDVGMLLGAPLLGIAASVGGYAWGFVAAAAVAMSGACLCWAIFRPRFDRVPSSSPDQT